MGRAWRGNLLLLFVSVATDYVGNGMNVYKDCAHYDGDEDCHKCCLHGFIFNCPSNCKEYTDGWSSVANNFYNEREVHRNCTVEIWKNSYTGKVSIGWYENGDTETE